MKIVFVCAAALLLGACAPAVISDINDSALKVQAGLGTTDEAILAEARRGCAIYGKTPVRISFVCKDEYCFTKDHLFACK